MIPRKYKSCPECGKQFTMRDVVKVWYFPKSGEFFAECPCGKGMADLPNKFCDTAVNLLCIYLTKHNIENICERHWYIINVTNGDVEIVRGRLSRNEKEVKESIAQHGGCGKIHVEEITDTTIEEILGE